MGFVSWVWECVCLLLVCVVRVVQSQYAWRMPTCRRHILASCNYPTRHKKKWLCTNGESQTGEQRSTLSVWSYNSPSMPQIKKLVSYHLYNKLSPMQKSRDAMSGNRDWSEHHKLDMPTTLGISKRLWQSLRFPLHVYPWTLDDLHKFNDITKKCVEKLQMHGLVTQWWW